MKTSNLEIARAIIHEKAPYFSAGLYRLKLVPVQGMGTLAVDDSQRLYYDPDLDLEPKVLASYLVHELLHLVDRHPERGAACDVSTDEEAAIFNTAADCALYALMRTGKWYIKDHLRPEHFNMEPGRPVEDYYRELRGQYDCAPRPYPYIGQGSCGSSATGHRAQWEQPRTERGSMSRDILRRHIAEAMRIHEKIHGSIPHGYERLVDDILGTPKVPWRRLLTYLLRGAAYNPGNVDFSRARPSKRQQATPDVIRPSMVQPSPHVAVVVDTSGSMSRDDLTDALSEVAGVIRATECSEGLRVYSCDSSVAAVSQVWHAGQVALHGGGGTNMVKGLREAAEHRPDVIIVVTDGHTTWTKQNPTGAHVIVALVGDGHAPLSSVPTWARGVEVNDG